MKRLAIITTHPIQYYAPFFELLSKKLGSNLHVFYTGGNNQFNRFDKGFKREITWDLPLLEGYEYTFLNNKSKDPGTHHYKGIINDDLIEKVTIFNPSAILVYGWAWQSHRNAILHFHKKTEVWFRGDSTLLDNSSSIKNFLKKVFLKSLYKKVNKVFYVGIENKKYFLEYGLSEENLVFKPHTVDNQRFGKLQNEQVSDLKTKLGISTSEILILFAGKLEDKKDPILLLNAFLRLTDSKIKLLFVGNGKLEEQIRQLSAGSDKVLFLPFQNQLMMPVIYQLSDLFCLPSKGPGETWGLAVNEAMAAGKAILTSEKVGCAKDLINEGVNGYTFKSGDVNDLHNKLLILTVSKKKLATMGAVSKDIIQEFCFENQVDSIMQEIKKI